MGRKRNSNNSQPPLDTNAAPQIFYDPTNNTFIIDGQAYQIQGYDPSQPIDLQALYQSAIQHQQLPNPPASSSVVQPDQPGRTSQDSAITSSEIELLTEAQHQGFARTSDRKNLYWRRYEPFVLQGQPPPKQKGTVLILHGFGEHVGTYEMLAREMTHKAGYHVVSYDQRGYGQSDGKRGHMSSIKKALTDLQTIIKEAVVLRPLYVLGHSSGGLLALQYGLKMNQLGAQKDPSLAIDGVLATAPYLRLSVDLPTWQRRVIKVVSKLWGSYSILARVDPSKMTHDPVMQKVYREDPLYTNTISVKHLTELGKAGQETLQKAEQFTLPFYIIHGTEDMVTDSRASQEFYEKANSVNKMIMLEHGLYHDLHLETSRLLVFGRIVEWLNREYKLREVMRMAEEAKKFAAENPCNTDETSGRTSTESTRSNNSIESHTSPVTNNNTQAPVLGTANLTVI